MIQKICGFRCRPFRAFILLECLTKLSRLLSHLLTQQLWAAQQFRCPRWFPACQGTQVGTLLASGGLLYRHLLCREKKSSPVKAPFTQESGSGGVTT